MDDPAISRTYKRRLQREAFRTSAKRRKIDNIFYRIYQPSQENNDQIHNESIDLDENNMNDICERLYGRLEEVNKKIDIIIVNQAKLNRSLLPNEKKFQKPTDLPPLPIKTAEELNLLETFFDNDNNFAAVCDYLSSFITSKDVAKSTVKIATRLLTNSMASTMSFKGLAKKRPFYKLKMWEVVQGSLLAKFDDTSLFEAEETMKTWLANAP